MTQRISKHDAEQRLKQLSAKDRIIGLDVEMLNRQVEERRQRELKEKEENSEFDKAALMVDNHLNIIEMTKQKVKREMEARTREYSLQHLDKTQSREYYLNDPDILKKEQPTRKSDYDPDLGVSSAQILPGEDILKHERVRRQAEQQKVWIEHQIYEKMLNSDLEKKADEDYYGNLEQIVSLRGAIEHEEAQMRRNLAKKVRDMNFDLARSQKAQSQRNDDYQKELEASEIEFNTTIDPFLCELPTKVLSEKPQSKGSSFEERVICKNAQSAQVVEKQAQKRDEQDKEIEWNKSAEGARRLLLCIEKDQKKLAAESRKQAMEENKRLAEEQNARRVADALAYKTGKVGNIFQD